MTREDLEVAVQHAVSGLEEIIGEVYNEDGYGISELYEIADKLLEDEIINFKMADDAEGMETVSVMQLEIGGRIYDLIINSDEYAIQTLSDIVDAVEDAQERYESVAKELGKYIVKVS